MPTRKLTKRSKQRHMSFVARHDDVIAAVLVWCPAPRGEAAGWIVQRIGCRCEQEIRPQFAKAISEFDIFGALERNVEPTGLEEQLASQRTIGCVKLPLSRTPLARQHR